MPTPGSPTAAASVSRADVSPSAASRALALPYMRRLGPTPEHHNRSRKGDLGTPGLIEIGAPSLYADAENPSPDGGRDC